MSATPDDILVGADSVDGSLLQWDPEVSPKECEHLFPEMVTFQMEAQSGLRREPQGKTEEERPHRNRRRDPAKRRKSPAS